jgi:hypothetical protein
MVGRFILKRSDGVVGVEIVVLGGKRGGGEVGKRSSSFKTCLGFLFYFRSRSVRKVI